MRNTLHRILNKCDNTLQNNNLSIEEFEKAFSSIKINKASGFDDISSNMVKISYCENSMKLGIFPDEMEIAKIKLLIKSRRKRYCK